MRAFAFVFVSLLAAPLAADCRSVEGNLLAGGNCGFDKDVAEWSAVPEGRISRDAGEKGAMKAEGDPGGSLTVRGPCVAVKGGAEVRVGARLKLSAGTPYFCSVNVFQYADAKCQENEEPLTSAGMPPPPAWKEVSGSAKAEASTKAVEIRPVCSGNPGFAVLFDDFTLSAN
jgi:hypothetical protein